MTASQGRGSLTRRDLLLVLLAASTLVAFGAVGVQRTRTLALERRAAADRVTVADVATLVAVEVERSLWAASDEARIAVAGGAPVPAGFVRADPFASPSGSPALSDAERAAPEIAAALDRARDSGQAILGPWVDRRGEEGPLIVVAAYARDPIHGQPTSTVERRARIVGWVVRPLVLSRVVAPAVPSGGVVSIRDGSNLAFVGATEVPTRLPYRVVATHDHQIEVRGGDPSSVPLSAPTIALALSSVVLSILAVLGLAALLRRLREHQADAEDRGAQIQLIGDVGPLVQQSLELADVLPAIAIQLSDHFELAGVSLSTFAGGQAVDLFTFGTPPSVAVKAVLRPPNRLAAGATLVLALERGGRSVAQLRLVADRDLDGAELQSLRAITELITAAVANASLYASQQEAMARLKDLDALKTGFLGTASHELRTPVTAISGFTTLLVDSWDQFDDAQRRHFVERIGANSRSLGAVVQDLLDFSLLDRGAIVLAVEAVDLGTLVQGVVERLSPVFGEHDILCSASPAPAIAGDVNTLERAVSNLLTNAAKFSPPGTTVTVTVGPSTVAGYGAEVVVSDEGPGIPREERQRVFTRFFRGTGDAVLRTRGVGIGLSVVAEVVALLRGDITVDDAPTGGARFTLRFPAHEQGRQSEEAAHASAP